MDEFVSLLKAIEEDRAVKVGFQLQWSSSGELTLDSLVRNIPPTSLRKLFEKIEQSEPPIISDQELKSQGILEVKE